MIETADEDLGGLDALEYAGPATKRPAGGGCERFRHHIMFPTHEHRGGVVGFGGRVLGEGELKYLESPETGGRCAGHLSPATSPRPFCS